MSFKNNYRVRKRESESMATLVSPRNSNAQFYSSIRSILGTDTTNAIGIINSALFKDYKDSIGVLFPFKKTTNYFCILLFKLLLLHIYIFCFY
jgi:hypothetical protein